MMAKLFGKGKGGGATNPSPDLEPDTDVESEEDYGDLPPDFEDEAIKAFPELEGSPEKLMSFWKAVRACMEG